MYSSATPSRNWFDQGGQAYARFRPDYPARLSAFLSSIAPDNDLALDVGCGNGQLTLQLASHFAAVVGVDPSADQIANAVPHERIRYQCAPAERLPLPDRSASLVTAAQAAHWFDLPVFYGEVRRVAVAGGILALISYGAPRSEPGLEERFGRFYQEEIGPYWPAERRLVDTGYATIDFPFEELSAPRMDIRLDWNLAELLGYVSTWSAVRRAREAGREDVLRSFAHELADAWGDAGIKRSITWPLNMRVGRI
ncbi:class I SAM-dependent methyltransferase [Thauera sinica]|uniref:Class I SAM-dependent methyltransferase n=1 Tax=Thauera sinica TaxID=2665146 RepID=A0ABW1ANS3_9RHOO|nr:class I SAM-dependent methyltransferase [Thauera sp. K11]ATE61967.1 SAM-dependent methyltransferase [Thauera sp. K11]